MEQNSVDPAASRVVHPSLSCLVMEMLAQIVTFEILMGNLRLRVIELGPPNS